MIIEEKNGKSIIQVKINMPVYDNTYFICWSSHMLINIVYTHTHTPTQTYSQSIFYTLLPISWGYFLKRWPTLCSVTRLYACDCNYTILVLLKQLITMILYFLCLFTNIHRYKAFNSLIRTQNIYEYWQVPS